MTRAEQFDKALDEAFKIIIRDRLERARKQLLATSERLKASKQDRNK